MRHHHRHVGRFKRPLTGCSEVALREGERGLDRCEHVGIARVAGGGLEKLELPVLGQGGVDSVGVEQNRQVTRQLHAVDVSSGQNGSD